MDQTDQPVSTSNFLPVPSPYTSLQFDKGPYIRSRGDGRPGHYGDDEGREDVTGVDSNDCDDDEGLALSISTHNHGSGSGQSAFGHNFADTYPQIDLRSVTDRAKHFSRLPLNESKITEVSDTTVPDLESIRAVSPGPGIGNWFAPNPVFRDDLGPMYHFNGEPLRLSAEQEHLRGKAVKHPLVPGELSFADLSETTGTQKNYSGTTLEGPANIQSLQDGYEWNRAAGLKIKTATKVILSLLQTNVLMVPLYQAAIKLRDFGPINLQQHLESLLVAYAYDLDDEATSELEHLLSRLVSSRAAFIAREIVANYRAGFAQRQHSQIEDMDRQVKEEDDPMSEKTHPNLKAVRRVLIESHAFISFRQRLTSLVYPTSSQIPSCVPVERIEENAAYTTNLACESSAMDGPGVTGKRTQAGFLQQWHKIFTEFLVGAGCLEPPLNRGWLRLRWRCRCGDSFHGDVMEYRKGAVEGLVEKMSRSTGAKVTVVLYNQTTTSQNWNFNFSAWPRRLIQNFTSTRIGTRNSTGCLPQHNNPTQASSTTSMTVSNTPASEPTLHLLACAHQTRRRKYLLQDRVDAVSTDRELFCFMKQQLKRNRNYIRKALSMRSVQGMFFVKFRLRLGNTVEVRDHNPCCTSCVPNTCQCIPPAPKVEPSSGAEYRCTPAGPIAFWPPVLSQDLMHMLNSPSCINEKETWVLEQLPKRTCGPLEGKLGQPVEGWGIYYQDGVDFDTVIGVVFGLFLLASLLFSVLWTTLEMDIQGAFGVSSYMVAASGISMAWLASKAKNFG